MDRSRLQRGSPAPADAALRASVRDDDVLNVETAMAGDVVGQGTPPPYRLKTFQRAALDRWVAGTFDPTPVPAETAVTSDGLTRSALQSAVGMRFVPGIEAGIIVQDPTLYLTPFDFRIDQTSVQAGDLTALMAQPWQADFFKCDINWWPTQRPDLAPQPGGMNPNVQWARGIATHLDMVTKHQSLGIVALQSDSSFLEVERANPL
jgi:hypothetical protein